MKKGLAFEKLIALIIVIIVIVLVALLIKKIDVLKEAFLKLFE